MGEYEVDGQSCWFVTQERMLDGVENNEFLDVGEHDSYIFGTTFNSVRDVMAENKLCVIDCKPECLKVLHNSHEFHPFVIYLRPPPIQEDPDEIKQENGHQNGHENGQNGRENGQNGRENGSINGEKNGSTSTLGSTNALISTTKFIVSKKVQNCPKTLKNLVGVQSTKNFGEWRGAA